MTTKLQSLLAALIVLALVMGPNPTPAQATGTGQYTLASLTPTWTTGIISDGVGKAGILVTDLNQDQKADTIACGNGYVYILNHTPDGGYETIWYSQYLGCIQMAAADRDANGVRELYVATKDGKVVILDGSSFQMVGTVVLPLGTGDFPPDIPPTDIEVADVDGDGGQEIVVVR
jgi:hypothetical protein